MNKKHNIATFALMSLLACPSLKAAAPDSAGAGSELNIAPSSASSMSDPDAALPAVAAGAVVVAAATYALAESADAVAALTNATADAVDAVGNLVDAVAEQFSYGGGESMSLTDEMLELRREILLDDLG